MVEIFDNIRKTYDFAAPAGELASFVEFHGETCLDKTARFLGGQPYTIKMFPSWTPTVYLNLGEAYLMTVDNKLYQIGRRQDVVILRDAVVERINQPADHIFITKFFPGGLEAILGITQLSLLDQVVDLREILPQRLIDHMRKADDFHTRCKLMDQFLLGRYRFPDKRDHYLKLVQDLTEGYATSGMQLNGMALSDKFFMSSKTVNRYFNKVIGISPKTYLSTIRARSALTSYINERSAFNPYRFGYFDQSHFYKDVIRFTGQKVSDHKF